MRKLIFITLVIFVMVFLGLSSLPVTKTIAEGTYANIGTGDAADAGPDALNFSQAHPITVDKYGKYILLTENRTSDHHWTFSNDNGSTWTQSGETYSFLLRGSVAYDANDDVLHVIWVATDPGVSGGVIYRRYSITRDVSHNITGIQRMDVGVNLQLDTSGGMLDQPTAVWVNDGSTNGILVAEWQQSGSGTNQIRSSMRKLDMTNNDGTAGNWVSITGSGDTFSAAAPNVTANAVYTSGTTIAAGAMSVRGGSGARKDDLYFFYAQGGVSGSIFARRAVWNSTNKDWSGGLQTAVTLGTVNNDNGGYNLKYQLLTRPILDSANDRLYIGWARWKDNTAGDTWSIAYLDSADTPSSVFDAYSANGSHAYAPTGDIAYDATTGYVYVSYIESTTNGTNGSIDYKIFDGSTFGPVTRFYTNTNGAAGADGSGDIPSMYDTRQNGRMLFAFRINGAIPPTALDPHTIDFGYITPVSPTSTPTPTPSPTIPPTPTPTVSSVSSGTSTSNASPPGPNSHTGWRYEVKGGPNYVGVPQFIHGDAGAEDAMVFINKDASKDDVFISINVMTPDDLQSLPKKIPFPWMQGYNTASDIFKFTVFAAFNGYSLPGFDKPVTLILPYDLSHKSWVRVNRLRIGRYDPITNRWKPVASLPVVNTTNKTIAITTKTSGYFAVLYPR